MKQVTQKLRSGEIDVQDVPLPLLRDSFVLVSTACSVISAGTEKSKIDMGRKNLLQKAMARPDLVRQVVGKWRAEGAWKTLRTVNNRLDALSPLGYSSAGTIIGLDGLVEGLRVGDRVACAGAGYANHAQIVCVPKHLLVPIPDHVSFEEAAFTTLGAIALQGVRLAEPLLGETFLVIGLGLLGQVTVQLLRAAGCSVLGCDINPEMVRLAESFGAVGIEPGFDPIEVCRQATGGYGVDGVVICAGTSSNQPIELAGEATREQGRVVVVGAVKMDIPRDSYFRKEIKVVISKSYGPGRYDPTYEEGGRDYPYGYVRFTEQRNMQTFLQLVAQGRVELQRLITHRFPLEQAPAAYALLEGERKEPYIGIVLNYEKEAENIRPAPAAAKVVRLVPPTGRLRISCAGAGNYATATLLPLLKDNKKVALQGLATASGHTARGVADQFGFSFCTAEINDLFGAESDLLLIASRHDSHAQLVVAALQARKHVYVEKPLGMNLEELQKIHAAFREASGCRLLVGFNRRFAPLTRLTLEHFRGVKSPRLVTIRINAGAIAADNWIQNAELGGGRLIGEGCHFIDLACALVDSPPVSVYAVATRRAEKSPLLNDNVMVTLTFKNGGVATVLYTADGSKALPKERVEVFGGGRSAVIDDFREATFYDEQLHKRTKRLAVQDKGQKAMLNALIEDLAAGRETVAYEILALSSLATVGAVESLLIDAPIPLDLAVLDAG